jgi:LuxR family maltose regulon positive regulatory protein
MNKTKRQFYENRLGGGGLIMTRPRVDTLLSEAFEKPVTLVYAGPGCGKSYAVNSYLTRKGEAVSWIQLTPTDSEPSRYWENLCNTIEKIDRDVAAKMRSMSFPGSDERFEKFYNDILDSLRPGAPYTLVFDDLHLIGQGKVLDTMIALAGKPFPGVSHVFISREESISPFDVGASDDDYTIIDERDLLFTKVEIADYLSMMDIEATPVLVDDIHVSTEGLAHLVNLAGKLIQRRPDATTQIRGMLKQNINKIIEDQFFEDADVGTKKFFMKLTLLDHLSESLVGLLPDSAEHMPKVLELTSLVRYDTYMRAYNIHHLLGEYLSDRRDLLTDEEAAEVFGIAAQWCRDNNYQLEAIGYYERMGDYGSIIEIGHSLQLDIDFHSGAYLLEIFENAPPAVFKEHPGAMILYTRMLLSLGRVDEAIEKSEAFIAELESGKITRERAGALVWLHTNYGFAMIIKTTDTGVYDFARYFEKAAEYAKAAGYDEAPITVNASIMPYACTVGNSRKGDPEKYIAEVTRAIPYAMRTMGGCLYGSDDLTSAEVAYYRGDMAGCERYALQSCLKAREKGQSYIESRALFLLLRMNLSRGRYDKITEILSQREELVKRVDMYNEHVLQDIALSWYYASIGELANVAPWVKNDFASAESESFVMGLGDMAKLKYYLAAKEYHTLLAFIDRRPQLYGIRKFLLGRIGITVNEAVALYNTKDRAGAMAALKKAYDLSAPTAFDMSFIEAGNYMRSLAGAALKDKGCDIPTAWLEQIRSKSATYAKRIAHVKSLYRQDIGKDSEIQLTLKEREVLQDMSQGLSRTEIAAYRGISVNTVKAMLQIIYEKLGADNSMDALRIAISNNLI